MKFLTVTLLVIALLVAGIATQDSLRPRAASRRAAVIRVGDSKSRVLSTLGPPTRTRPVPWKYSHLGFPQPVLWCYGRNYDWHRPFSRRAPYIVHCVEDEWSFSPEADDVLVEFDGAGKVASVRLPAI